MPEVKDEEKDDGSRAAGEGPSPSLSLSLFFLQFPIPRSSTYIPADTARCSCFYHYCYYNFGGWTSDEPMRRLSGWERYEKNGEGVGEGRYDPAAERER